MGLVVVEGVGEVVLVRRGLVGQVLVLLLVDVRRAAGGLERRPALLFAGPVPLVLEVLLLPVCRGEEGPPGVGVRPRPGGTSVVVQLAPPTVVKRRWTFAR